MFQCYIVYKKKNMHTVWRDKDAQKRREESIQKRINLFSNHVCVCECGSDENKSTCHDLWNEYCVYFNGVLSVHRDTSFPCHWSSEDDDFSPILVDLRTSLEGIFLSSSIRASNIFSLVWPGNSRMDLNLSMSSITTTLCLYTEHTLFRQNTHNSDIIQSKVLSFSTKSLNYSLFIWFPHHSSHQAYSMYF